MPIQPQPLSITWLSLLLNVLLGIFKCGVGLWVNSKAIFADGLHSFTDLSTDVVALLGLKMGSKPRDDNHLYGHHKFNDLSILFISVVLLFFCLGLIYSSMRGLVSGEVVNPEWPAILIAFVSLVTKEWLFWKTRSIAIQAKSRLLMTNAWHHRTDSVSSFLVFVALVAIALGGQGWAFLDRVVGLILGAYLAAEGIRMFLRACRDLLDTAPEQEIINDIREHILPVPGAVAYHQFRARRVGDLLEVDLHLQVEPTLSVEKGHAIAKTVKGAILEKHPEVIDVLIHIEPADAGHVRDEGIYDIDKGFLSSSKKGDAV